MRHLVLKTLTTLSALTALSVSALCANGQSQTSVPPNSFLDRPVRDVHSLIRQIAADPRVADRYSRLFKMPPQMVEEALATLHVEKLPRERALQIWGVALAEPGQPMASSVRKLRAGELVFAQPDGTPVLVKRCGNPVRTVRAQDASVALQDAPYWNPYEALPQAPLEQRLAEGLPLPDAPDLPQAASAVPPESSGLAPPQASEARRRLALWLAPIPFLPLLFGGGSTQSGSEALGPPPPLTSGAASQPPVYPGSAGGPPPVPEGGPITFLIGAGLGLAVCRRRRAAA